MAGAVKNKNKDGLHIGGQAVYEGVMLKSENNLAVVVRNPENRFVTYKEITEKKSRFLRMPFIRGIVNFIEMLDIGIRSLIWSSNQALDEKEKISKKDVFFMLALSIFMVILFFMVAPAYITKLITKIIPEKGFMFSLIEGVIRISFFLAYVFFISFSSDVRTLFQYHGAEHKVVNCYEHKRPLTLKNVKKYTTLHRRCGTSFIIIVLILSVLIFSLLPYQNIFYRIGLKILLVPILVSLSYELIRIGARYPKNFLFKIFVLPGLWLQKITTREPTDKQLEVAIRTIKTLLKMEGVKTG